MTDSIQYLINVTGDQYDHQAFLETVANFNGAEVIEQKNVKAEQSSLPDLEGQFLEFLETIIAEERRTEVGVEPSDGWFVVNIKVGDAVFLSLTVDKLLINGDKLTPTKEEMLDGAGLLEGFEVFDNATITHFSDTDNIRVLEIKTENQDAEEQ